MRQQQFIRFVQEICFLLKLSQPCSKTALQYFLQFKEYENHSYDQEILVGACIYLSVKIFEEEVRIRDILNMIYVLTSLYKMSAEMENEQGEKDEEGRGKEEEKKEEGKKQSVKEKENSVEIERTQKQAQNQNKNQIIIDINQSPHQQASHQQQQQQRYILLKNIQHLQNLNSLIQPKYSLSDYNQYKGKIIQAQQILLRILGFSFSLSQQNKKQLKRLLITIHYLRLPSTMAETILKIYNDMHYIDIPYSPEGVVYFGFLVTKVFVQEKQKKREQKVSTQQQVNFELKETFSETSHKKIYDKELAEINKIKDFITLMTPKKWQELLCTDINQLQNYAEKLTNFYSAIHIIS